MKKRFVPLFVAVLMVCSIFTACGQKEEKEISADEVSKKIVDTVSFPDMLKIEQQAFDRQYAMDASLITKYSVYMCASGAQADELAIFEAADESKADAVKKAVETRLNDVKDRFVDYAPDEMGKIDSSIITVKGKYVFFVINDNADAAEKIFNESF